jgi:hypothetical protein
MEWAPLRPDRVAAFARVLLATWAICLGALLYFNIAGPTTVGAPEIARDFASFWTAGRMTLGGDAAEVYHPAAHLAAQQALYAGAKTGYAAFFYPPIFLFACLPLALLPFGVAAVAWVLATGALYAAAVRRLLPGGVVAALAFPAAFINAAYAQNGFLSAGLFALAALWLERRPALAGACLGALAYKPQLGLLAPVALAAAGRWRAFGAAAAIVALLALASALAFGPATWRGFIAVSPLARQWLQDGSVDFGKMISVFAALRLLGASLGVAYAAQAILTVASAALLARLVRRRPGGAAEIAALVAATLLATPFALHYDLVILAVPLAWLLAEARRGGFLSWERTTLALLYVAPLPLLVAGVDGVPLTPLAILALLTLLTRRLRAARN